MSSIRADVTGEAEALIKRLKSFQEIDIAATTRSIAEGLRTSTVERFEKSVSPEGKKWKSSIRASETGGKTLIKSNDLRSSIRSEADESGLAVGTNKIYAASHQFGATGRRIQPKKAKTLRFQIGGKWISAKEVRISIPARPFLGISEEDNEEIKKLLNEMMEG